MNSQDCWRFSRLLPDVAIMVCVLLGWGLLARSTRAEETDQPIGHREQVYTLAAENSEVRGLAWDEVSPEAPRLFALDGSGKVFVYKPAGDDLKLVHTCDLSLVVTSPRLASPRGLAFAVEEGRGVFYLMDWSNAGKEARSRLWRCLLEGSEVTASSSADLSSHWFRMGEREVFDLAYDDGRLLVSFDASGYADPNLRVLRGLLRITWDGPFGESTVRVQHMADAGTAPARGLAVMPMEGARYLWATVGNDHIYCAEARTGRGLFFFERPQSHEDSPSCWGMCFGQGALWVSENVPGPDRVHRVNVTRNLDASAQGPRVPRRLIMTIRTEPETEGEEAGVVRHYYSRPYDHDQMPNQGVWVETETIADVSGAAKAVLRMITHDPGGDRSSRQFMQCVEYGDGPAGVYSSRYEIDLWTNPYKKFVYPHRVDGDRTALEGSDYLADDPVLYNLGDTSTYRSFIERVRAHIREKYGVEADLQNPYWAARNVVEYIQDHYYYPSRPKQRPATVDYDRQHYDANPGNLKIELSAEPYNQSQIIACSGTSVMVAGAMRHLGIPARWLGTGTELGPAEWDSNGNGLLDQEETAPCSNGHRYTQVWLGSHYGWICFDATPSKPAFVDYDPPPPLQSQWRYMTRAASGHREPQRVVFNVGSESYGPLYRDFEWDPRLAVDNDCGGDQRYNLQGKFEKPERWKLPRHRIAVKNLCFITQVRVGDPGSQTRVTWELEGAWDRIGPATVSLYLQQRSDPGRPWREVARLAGEIPCDARLAVVDLSSHPGRPSRIVIRRDGDGETGGMSAPFD